MSCHTMSYHTMSRPNMTRPNVVLVMVDQMAHDVVASLGHGAVVTPHLDALVQAGVTFENAYCNSPLCASSRASFVTGKLVRHTGVYDNGAELPAAVPTLLHHLNRAGYTTVLSGKMHFNGPDQLHGFQERLTTDLSPAGFLLTPDWTRGAYPNPGTSVERLRYAPLRAWTLQLAYDEEVLQAALARLRQLREESAPFFLCASFAHPHDPFQVPEAFWKLYEGKAIPPPRAPARALADLHPYNRWIQVHHEADRVPLSEEETERARRAYLAMVSYADSLVGRLVSELKRLAFKNTLFIFTSDHGEMLGEHGMWFKRTFYDPATKVPLVVWGDGLEPASRTEVVSLVDLSATLLDLADVPDKAAWLGELDGDSFGSLLTGTAAWKNSAVSEYYAEGTVQPMLLLRKGVYKYVYVHEHAPLLFDLAKDPLELNDLAPDPVYRDTARGLEAELLAGLDVGALRERVLQSQRERLLIVSAGAKSEDWAYEARRNAANLYGRPKP